MVTNSHYESSHHDSSPEWVPIGLDHYTRLTRAFIRGRTSVRSVPEQLYIKAVTGACTLINGCSLELCSATHSMASSGICHRNKVNSIAWLYRGPWLEDSIIIIILLLIMDRKCRMAASQQQLWERVFLRDTNHTITNDSVESSGICDSNKVNSIAWIDQGPCLDNNNNNYNNNG